MNSGKYVFTQILQFVSKYEFEKCVSRYKGDHRVRELNCWNQFIQLSLVTYSLNSLRYLTCLKAIERNYIIWASSKMSISRLSPEQTRREIGGFLQILAILDKTVSLCMQIIQFQC